jgi:nucleoside-diphosphate-sugar epimerase
MAQRGLSGRLFCFGLGYTAQALARALGRADWRVGGTTRTAENRARLVAQGLDAWLFGRDHPLDTAATALAGTTHVLTSVPPDAAGEPVLDHHLHDLLALEGLAWAGYLSTTGVYGDRGGEWVYESDPPAPGSARTRARVAAEGRWLASGLPVHVFRLAGIYGPGRSALDAVRAGTARRIVKPGQMFGRIHVEDIARVLEASIARPNPGAIYNVADDEPAPPQDVIAYAAHLLGIPAPPEIPFERAELSPMARSFYVDNRRVANDRIRRELGVELAYPTYREGLERLLGPGSAR